MNKILDEVINNVVQQYYDYIISKYDERQIFNVFNYKKIKYGFTDQKRDIKIIDGKILQLK